MSHFAKQALEEYNSDTKTVRHGGQNGNNFWNLHSSQFMFVPAFQFPALNARSEYIYTATDCNGKQHVFTDRSSCAPLTPIWKDIPEGVVELKVYALDDAGEDRYLAGARTFYKLAPFSDDLPPAVRSYKDCVADVYAYAFRQSLLQHWLTHGTPDPDYDLNVYPSKMISAIIVAMLDDSATVKRFYKEDGQYRLQPENQSMEPIYTKDLTILGEVVSLFRLIK